MKVPRAAVQSDGRSSALAGGKRPPDAAGRNLRDGCSGSAASRPQDSPAARASARGARSIVGRSIPSAPGALANPQAPKSPYAPAPQSPHAPQSKEGIVARLFEAFSRRDLETTLTLVHPEIVFQPLTAEVTRAGEPYCGHEGLRRYLEDVEAHWDELTVHPAQIRAAGRAVVALGLVSGSGPAGSFENAPTTWVVKFKGDLVVHAQIFSDPRHVVEALGGED